MHSYCQPLMVPIQKLTLVLIQDLTRPSVVVRSQGSIVTSKPLTALVLTEAIHLF
jgi:hypothetical protein